MASTVAAESQEKAEDQYHLGLKKENDCVTELSYIIEIFNSDSNDSINTFFVGQILPVCTRFYLLGMKTIFTYCRRCRYSRAWWGSRSVQSSVQ